MQVSPRRGTGRGAWAAMAEQPAGQLVQVQAGPVTLDGDLAVPEGARAIVLFAHGSGSRLSPRNRHVAGVLRSAGLATLLTDLLTREEEEIDTRTARLRFDIPLLARRLVAVVDWLRRAPSTASLRVGLFGASTGAAAALIASAERPAVVGAVVSRGGRPDLAGAEVLGRVAAPTLLIVGALDAPVVRLNEAALEQIRAQKELAIVPGASHLFEEPGALDHVARLAALWFTRYVA